MPHNFGCFGHFILILVILIQSCLTLCDPMDNSPGQNIGVGSLSSPGDLPNPGIKPRSPTLQADSLPAEPQGKPKVYVAAAAAAKSLQLCPTLLDPMDCSLPGSSTHGIFQARVLEWGAIAFSEVYVSIPLIRNTVMTFFHK